MYIGCMNLQWEQFQFLHTDPIIKWTNNNRMMGEHECNLPTQGEAYGNHSNDWIRIHQSWLARKSSMYSWFSLKKNIFFLRDVPFAQVVLIISSHPPTTHDESTRNRASASSMLASCSDILPAAASDGMESEKKPKTARKKQNPKRNHGLRGIYTYLGP